MWSCWMKLETMNLQRYSNGWILHSRRFSARNMDIDTEKGNLIC
jgi:hypothetical protein